MAESELMPRRRTLEGRDSRRFAHRDPDAPEPRSLEDRRRPALGEALPPAARGAWGGGRGGTRSVRDAIAASGAHAGFLAAVADDGVTVALSAAIGMSTRFLRAYGESPLDAELPWSRSLRCGRPELVGNSEAAVARCPRLARFLGRSVEALAVLPLRDDDRSSGALVLLFGAPRDFAQSELRLLESLAGNCAHALERASLNATMAAMAAEQRRLSRILDHLDEAVIALGADLTVQYCNRAAELLLDPAPEVGGRLAESWHGVALHGLIAEVAASASPEAHRVVAVAAGRWRELTARRGDGQAPLILEIRETVVEPAAEPAPARWPSTFTRAAESPVQLVAHAPHELQRVGAIEIDLPGSQVKVDDRPVRLTPSEFRLLSLLAQQPGRVVSRKDIVRHLWQSGHLGDGRMCDGHVANLRRKIERDAARPERLVTVRGKGYKLIAA